MAPDALMQPPVIILLRPQMGENIGSSARAMKNCGISELRLVAPRDGWPNPLARPMAASGADILDNATVYDDIGSAMHDVVQHLLPQRVCVIWSNQPQTQEARQR